MRNRFKGLALIECLKNYGRRFVTLYRKQGSRPSPWKRNAKKQNGCLGKPYKYTEEVTNRSKGLDLIDRVPEDLWTEVPDIVQ